jgi:hypothetical protein
MRYCDYRLKVCEEELVECYHQLQETQEKYKLEKAAVAAAAEKIQKLEQRLIFVAKVSMLALTAYLWLKMHIHRKEKAASMSSAHTNLTLELMVYYENYLLRLA